MQGQIDTLLDTLPQFIASGGPFMIPLLLVCCIMWSLILERLLFFRKLHGKNMIRQNHPTLAQHEDPIDTAASQTEAESLTRQEENIKTILLHEFLRKRGNPGTDGPIVDEICFMLSRRTTAFLACIGVLAAAAPLIGLLGTVSGMMKTFDVLSFFGTGNARALANGISEALITTQSGLLIAIPGLYMKSFLERRTDTLQNQIRIAGYSLKRQLRSTAEPLSARRTVSEPKKNQHFQGILS